MLDSRLADIAVIVCACLANRCIDNKLNIAVCNGVRNVRTSALVNLEDTLTGDSCFNNEIVALVRCNDIEAQLTEALCYVDKLRLISVTNTDKYRAAFGEVILCSLLCLIVSLAEALGDSENFTC